MKVVSREKHISEHNGVKEILEESITHNFNSVIVFGFKDGQVRIKKSKVSNNLELIGALEAAKTQIWGDA